MLISSKWMENVLMTNYIWKLSVLVLFSHMKYLTQKVSQYLIQREKSTYFSSEFFQNHTNFHTYENFALSYFVEYTKCKRIQLLFQRVFSKSIDLVTKLREQTIIIRPILFSWKPRKKLKRIRTKLTKRTLNFSKFKTCRQLFLLENG